MTTHTNEVFENQTIELDGNIFENCTFKNCELIYSGGYSPGMTGNKFESCRWGFDGPAARTIQFMRAIYSSGGQNLVETTFAKIRGQMGGFSIPR